jgi:hypothetical protein
MPAMKLASEKRPQLFGAGILNSSQIRHALRSPAMEGRMENTPSAGVNNDPVHCFVAIELSKSSWVVGFSDALVQAD